MNHLTLMTAAGALAAFAAPAQAAPLPAVPAPLAATLPDSAGPIAKLSYGYDDDDWRDRRRWHEHRGRDWNRPYRGRYWRGKDGRLRCRRDDGTTGLLIGAGVGALLGREIDNRGDRTLGTVLGAVGGGLLGREIDRGEVRCR